jgi:hypothetical protein
MNWLSSALRGIGHFFTGLFTNKAAQDHALAVLEEAGKVAATLYPIVKQVATLTPNRTDDEIVAAIEAFGLAGLVDPTLKDKAAVLHDIVLAVAKKIVPGVGSSILSLAIESAYQVLKANVATKTA